MKKEYIILMHLNKIEKAISMPNRYEVFAQASINLIIEIAKVENIDQELSLAIYETFNKYKKALNIQIKENQEIIKIINEFLNKNEVDEINVVNFKKENTFHYLDKLTKNRHSVRNYNQQEVSYILIEKAVKIANRLPTPCNRQACFLLIIENKNVREKILNTQQGNKGFSAPILAAIVVDKEAFTQEYESFAPYFHAGSFTAGLILGLESLGVSSCILNWHVNTEQDNEIKSLLNLTSKEITAFMFIGYGEIGKNEAYSIKRNPQFLIEIIK